MERSFVIGDPHFREGSVREMELFIEETLRIIKENSSRADYIVVLGDIMDRHGILHQKPFHQSCRFLIELAKLLPTYCLIGNHDFDIPSKYLPENHPFKVMTWTEIPGLTIIDKPRLIHGKFFTPYVPPGMFNKAIEDVVGEPGWEALVRNKIGLVYAHQEFRGCRMGRIVSETGDLWPERFGEAPFVVSGHIHDYQMVGGNVMYVGTPVQVNFGEGRKRGICLFNMVLEEGVPRSYELEWFPIRVPKKLSKTIHIDFLDAWIEKRFLELMEKYELPIPKILTKKPTEIKGFDFIQKLSQYKDKITSLADQLKTDPFIDQYRLQILVGGKLSNTVLKNIIFKVRDLPLAIQQVFLSEAPSSSSDTSDLENEEEREERRKSWMDHLTSVIKESDEKRELLNDVLKHLSDKRCNNTGGNP
jgi:UDP-2,3-diacylglucosamine pyrophosphatase LpxH